MNTDRIHTWLWVAAAVLLVAGAALLQGPLSRVSGAHEQLALRERIARENPEYMILTVAPGGLRAPFVAYLWIRAEDLKNEGRFYDAKQNADLICMFQPRFAGAWAFNAWNMSYNISVATHTPRERWNWVSNGFKLLRDKGISYNPKALNLYKELSWIFFHKIGGTTDNMHRYYKRRLAGEMQRLLAPPSYGTTREVVAAFRPIAEAPLDKVVVARALPLPWLALVVSMLAGVAGLSILAIPRRSTPTRPGAKVAMKPPGPVRSTGCWPTPTKTLTKRSPSTLTCSPPRACRWTGRCWMPTTSSPWTATSR